jgi:hypothetical protein
MCTVNVKNKKQTKLIRAVADFSFFYRGADKSLARPTSRCILFDGKNMCPELSRSPKGTQFDLSLCTKAQKTHNLTCPCVPLSSSWGFKTKNVTKGSRRTQDSHFFFSYFPIRNILEAFAKSRKATVSFVLSVCSSIRMEQLGSHWTDFHEIWFLSIFRKYVGKIQVSLKFNVIITTVPEDPCTFMIISRSVLHRVRNVSDKRW